MNMTNNKEKELKNKNGNSKKNVSENSKNVSNKNSELKKAETRKKNEKKANIKQVRKQLYYSNNVSSSSELSKLIKIVLIVTVIMLVFYGVTIVVTNKAKEAAKEEEPAVEIQYDSIMIGSMVNIEGTFYVLIEDEDDIRLSEYETFIQTIKANDDAPTIYTADLNNSFNKKYLSDEASYDSNMETFKVKGTTLVSIKDHKIVDVYDSYEEILNKLKNLE